MLSPILGKQTRHCTESSVEDGNLENESCVYILMVVLGYVTRAKRAVHGACGYGSGWVPNQDVNAKASSPKLLVHIQV